MGSQFLQQFMAGWQMGQSRNENTRRNQEMEMERQRQEQMLAQRAQEYELRKEEFAAQKKRLAAEEAAHKVAAAKEAYELRTQASSLQGFPAPTAQDVGIQQTTPSDVGPTLDQINVPQPMQAMPNPMEGQPDIQMPVLTGPQQQQMQQEEQQRKMREALGMLDAQEGIKAQYREKPKGLDEIFAEAKARAAGGRAGAPLASSGGSMSGEGGKPLLSGEINKFNDFRSGLNTMDRLAGEVEKTGAAAKAGAMVPGFITEMTGLGAEAKSRQAVLDQAKQVIGKAMEGGVLRKEDETKYMKILPIIGDPPAVAKSKLLNLKSVMAQDAEIYLETLEAAGRNVTKVRETLEKQLGPTTTGGLDPEVERRLKALGY
jgi:hypothetical protein